MNLELDEHPSPENFRTIVDGVRTFNRNRTGREWPRPVAYYLRDAEERIIAGVQGTLWGRSMHIDALWVDEQHRGNGYGSELMTAIENYAAAHAHPLVYLETTSFQALPFYEGLGYRIFGELPGISEDETLYFLKKEM
jgi:ribosomal protein S18 acetylase RimI-like enzyme